MGHTKGKKTRRGKRPLPCEEKRQPKTEEGRKDKPSSGGGDQLQEWIKSILIAVVLFLLIRSFLLNTFVIISGSMEETLLVGDLLVVNRAAVGSRIPGTSIRIPGYSSLRRGDIVVFDPHHEVDMRLVKRLIGLPGDTLMMRDKSLFVNGEPAVEPYVRQDRSIGDFNDTVMGWQEEFLTAGADRASYHPTRDNWGSIVVPEGHLFLLGDNRDESYDSRYWGFLDRNRIVGRVALIYFSYNKESLRPFPWLREIRWSRIGHRVRQGRQRHTNAGEQTPIP